MADMIRIDGDELASIAVRMAQIQDAMQQTYGAVNQVQSNLNWNVRIKAEVEDQLQDVGRRLSLQKNKLAQAASVTSSAAEEAGILDSDLAKQVEAITWGWNGQEDTPNGGQQTQVNHYFFSADKLKDVDPNGWRAGCYIGAISMMVSNVTGQEVPPEEIWKLNGEQVFIKNWDTIAKNYGLKQSQIKLDDSTLSKEGYATKEDYIRALCKEHPEGIILQGTIQKGGNAGSDHAVVAYLDSDGETIRINDPGWNTYEGQIIGAAEKNGGSANYNSFDSMYKIRIFEKNA